MGKRLLVVGMAFWPSACPVIFEHVAVWAIEMAHKEVLYRGCGVIPWSRCYTELSGLLASFFFTF